MFWLKVRRARTQYAGCSLGCGFEIVEIKEIASTPLPRQNQLNPQPKNIPKCPPPTPPIPSFSSTPSSAKMYLTPFKSALLTAHLTLVISMASISTGLITTSIARIATDLSIPPQTSYWPLSVYGLTSGACLLVAGAIADAVGPQRVFGLGNLLLSAFMLAAGLARANIQVVVERAMQGFAVALCFPSSVRIIAHSIKPGGRRNLAFTYTGLG